MERYEIEREKNSSQDNVNLQLNVSERGKLDSVKRELKKMEDFNKTRFKSKKKTHTEKKKIEKRNVVDEISLLSEANHQQDTLSN